MNFIWDQKQAKENVNVKKTFVPRIKHNWELVKQHLLDPNYWESMSLLFYDFNQGAWVHKEDVYNPPIELNGEP